MIPFGKSKDPYPTMEIKRDAYIDEITFFDDALKRLISITLPREINTNGLYVDAKTKCVQFHNNDRRIR